MEKGRSMDETTTTLHPCWEAYRLADKYVSVPCGYLTHTHIQKEKPMSGSDELVVVVFFRRELVIYLNAFSGEATTEFPSTLQMARGGVCFLRS